MCVTSPAVMSYTVFDQGNIAPKSSLLAFGQPGGRRWPASARGAGARRWVLRSGLWVCGIESPIACRRTQSSHKLTGRPLSSAAASRTREVDPASPVTPPAGPLGLTCLATSNASIALQACQSAWPALAVMHDQVGLALVNMNNDNITANDHVKAQYSHISNYYSILQLIVCAACCMSQFRGGSPLLPTKQTHTVSEQGLVP